MNNINYADFLMNMLDLNLDIKEEYIKEIKDKSYFGEREDIFYSRISSMIIKSNKDEKAKRDFFDKFMEKIELGEQDKNFRKYNFEKSFIFEELAQGKNNVDSYPRLREVYMKYMNIFTDEVRKQDLQNEFLGLAIRNDNTEDMKLILKSVKQV